MEARKKLIEESGADLMISIHQNSYTDPKYWGPQVFYQKGISASAALAEGIQEEMNRFTAPGNTRKAKENDTYFILQQSPMPAVLVECGFVTNSKDSENLSSPQYQKRVAWGIYMGIEAYFGGSGLAKQD